jgi:hypothetical protein
MIMDKKEMVLIMRKLVNSYNIEWDLIDLESEIDSKLSFEENWNYIKEKFELTQLEELKERIENARQ